MKRLNTFFLVLIFLFGYCSYARADVLHVLDLDFRGSLAPTEGVSFLSRQITASVYYVNDAGVSLYDSGDPAVVRFDPFVGSYDGDLPLPRILRSAYVASGMDQILMALTSYAVLSNVYDNGLIQRVGGYIFFDTYYHSDINSTLAFSYSGDFSVQLETSDPFFSDIATSISSFGFSIDKKGAINSTSTYSYSWETENADDKTLAIAPEVYSFDVQAGEDITVRLFARAELYRVTTVVPEPVSAVLMLLGGGAMFVRRRICGFRPRQVNAGQ